MHRHWKLPNRSLKPNIVRLRPHGIHDSNDSHFSLSKFMSDISLSRSPSPELSAAEIENMQLKARIYELENRQVFSLCNFRCLSLLTCWLPSLAEPPTIVFIPKPPTPKEGKYNIQNAMELSDDSLLYKAIVVGAPSGVFHSLETPHSLHSSLLH
jgi:hypothetical protein